MQSNTIPYEINNEEVVLNLWAYSDEYGNIQRIAGKAYVLDGEDVDKLNILRQLSRTDFLSAKWYPVPKNFNLKGYNGDELKGVAQAFQVSDPYINGILFDEVMSALAKELPEHLRLFGDDYQRFTIKLPESPLCITTIVVEYSDGSLVPMVEANR
ncbi:MAG: hypothetical protein Q8N02_08545 [Methylotenera sp.]|nr:hypothetical protein [Methylotenera sp.]MDP3095612.1 hypothetical protein [Methylotenera sp.]